ncbi:MAG: NTP transferase domain-containing protein [Parcubacteria group bacterium]|nr:NTP transferase domain-containing protein [Parcubacteria group bacterium]
MKRSRITITIRKDILPQIDNIVDKEKIRNRSHAIEYLTMKGLRSGIKKAYILAGTRGSHVKSLTSNMPKAMLKVNGRPVLEHIISQLKENSIKNIYILVGYKKEAIKKYFKDGKKFGVKITYIDCNDKIGTGNALFKAKKHLSEESFLMLYGDTLANVDLKDLLAFHEEQNSAVTLALTSVQNPEGYGVVKLRGSKILGFLEKPERKPNLSRVISAGIYVIDSKVLNLIPKNKKYSKLERDVLPKLAMEGNLYGYHFDGEWYDIGNLEAYERAKKEWSSR